MDEQALKEMIAATVKEAIAAEKQADEATDEEAETVEAKTDEAEKSAETESAEKSEEEKEDEEITALKSRIAEMEESMNRRSKVAGVIASKAAEGQEDGAKKEQKEIDYGGRDSYGRKRKKK